MQLRSHYNMPTRDLLLLMMTMHWPLLVNISDTETRTDSDNGQREEEVPVNAVLRDVFMIASRLH